MRVGMASASTHSPCSFSLLPLGGRGGKPWNATSSPQTSPSSLGAANEAAWLVPRPVEAAGSAWPCNPLVNRHRPWDRLKTMSVGMSGLSCARRKGEEAVVLRILAEQRCAEMVAEWLLQVVFDFCTPFFYFPLLLFCIIWQSWCSFSFAKQTPD